MVPERVVSNLVVGARRQLGPRLQVEDRIQLADVPDHAIELFLDLLLRNEDVGIVLRDLPHARKPVQRSRELVAVKRRRFGVAHGQLLIGVDSAVEEQHVPRAVHRLEAVYPLSVGDQEHVLAVLLPVSGGDPDAGVVDEGRPHLDVPVLLVHAPP